MSSINVKNLVAVQPSTGSKKGCLTDSSAAAVRDALNADKSARKDLREFDLYFPCEVGKGFRVVCWLRISERWCLASYRFSYVFGYDRFLRSE